MKKSEVVELVTFLSNCVGQSKLTPDQAEAYALMLADLDSEVLKRAVYQLGRTSKFFPSVSEVRARCAELQSPGVVKTGDDAWGDVLVAISEHGYTWKHVAFGDPLVDKIVRNMGWINLCQSENIVADRAHFIRAYEMHRGEFKAEIQRSQGALPSINQLRLPAEQPQHALPTPSPYLRVVNADYREGYVNADEAKSVMADLLKKISGGGR